MFSIRYTVSRFWFTSKFCLICGLVDVRTWIIRFIFRQFAMRNQNYGGSLAGLGPQRSPPTDTNEPSSPIMALMAGSQAPSESSQSCAEEIFTGSSSLMAGNTSSLMANPANPLHSGLRGLGLYSLQNILWTIKTKKPYSHVGAILSPVVVF